MIEKISLALINESGDVVTVQQATTAQLEIKIETTTADTFSAICRRNNNITDAEIKTAEKFRFALNLKEYLEDMKNAD